jgi:hypothetical protein
MLLGLVEFENLARDWLDGFMESQQTSAFIYPYLCGFVNEDVAQNPENLVSFSFPALARGPGDEVFDHLDKIEEWV